MRNAGGGKRDGDIVAGPCQLLALREVDGAAKTVVPVYARSSTPEAEGERALGRNDKLHSLVFACSDCNHAKGRAHLMTFNVATGIVYELGLSIGTGGTCCTVHRRHPARPSAQAANASSSRTGASASRNWRALASQVNVWPYAAQSPRLSASALVIA